MNRSKLFATAFAAMATAFVPSAFAAQQHMGGGGGGGMHAGGGMRMHGGGMGGMRIHGGGMGGMRMHGGDRNFKPGIVHNNPGNFGVSRHNRGVRLGQNWGGKGDHHRHHRRGFWRGGTFIALGYPYYDDYYYGGDSYGCDYYYDRWQETGSRYWRIRYYQCID